MRKILLIYFMLAFGCIILYGGKREMHLGDWREFSPAVERMDCHLRVESKAGSSFGIDIAAGDTLSWKRYVVVMPNVLPDDLNNSLKAKIVMSQYVSDKLYNDSLVETTVFTDKPKSVGLSLKISGVVSNAALDFGDNAVVKSMPVSFPDSVPLFIRSVISGGVKIVRETFEYTPKPVMGRTSFLTLDELYDYLTISDDPHEGLWNFYDRTTSPLRAAPNGEYVIATVRKGDDYDIIYIRDNEKISSTWNPLDIKGRMSEGDVEGVFDVIWLDRSKDELRSRVTGVIEGNILTFNFPYWKVAMRFSKKNFNK